MADTLQVTPAAPAADPTTPPAGAQVQPAAGDTTRVSVPTDQPASEQKPAEKLLAGKFKSAEELERSYLELQAKLGQPKTPEPAREKPAEMTPEQASKAVTDAGLDLAALSQEYATSGKLTDESYQQLAAKGITKETVDAFIAGQQARANEYRSTLAKTVGGDEELTKLLQWAGANLTKAEIDSANKALSSGDTALATLTLQGLRGRYTADVGDTPSRINGEGARPAGIEPFKSTDEIVRAMQDRRYKDGDPAYHAEVQKRLAVTPTFIG